MFPNWGNEVVGYPFFEFARYPFTGPTTGFQQFPLATECERNDMLASQYASSFRGLSAIDALIPNGLYGARKVHSHGLQKAMPARKPALEAQDQYSEAETVARREAALKRMLATPPKPHKEMVGQSKGRPAKKQKPKAS